MIRRTGVCINNHHSFYCLIATLILITIQARTDQCQHQEFKVYSLADGLLSKIYLLKNQKQSLFMTVSCKQPNILSISINQSRNARESPRFDIYSNHSNQPKTTLKRTVPFSQCNVFLEQTPANILQIKRSPTSNSIFTISSIAINHQHHEIIVEDESMKWGLGERFQQHFQITDGHWTIWNRDRPWMMDSGLRSESCQTYGHQPVYLAKENFLGQYHLVYFKNTHGLMVQSTKSSEQLNYNSVGGNIHFILVLGQSNPEEVLEIYHQFIGRGHIPPFWSLGYHQSRWGYKSISEVETVVDFFEYYDIPIDAFWLDLDYMKDKMIFTIDEQKYPADKLNNLMKDYNLKLVPLLDVAIAVNDRQTAKLGKDMNVFLRSHSDKEYYYKGQVWPGEVYYIDFLHPNASAFWQAQLSKLYQKIKFSGIWLDMNEPTNFRGGDEIFEPYPVQKKENINSMTINVNIQHYSTSKEPLFHAEVHAYYGHLTAIPTFEFLSTLGRPFILTRSNSVGSGLFAAHWTGDNVANWDFLKSSINSNFLFQIFGMQMVGSDICGFYQSSNENLCCRWMQLGSFYPFARNHNHESSASQQPYSFGDIHLQTSLKSLKTRYALLKQMYTWLLMKKGKGSFFRPLAFEFYDDETTFIDFVMETQFLIGRSLMVTPIVEPMSQSRAVYFPGEHQLWYQFQIDIQRGSVDSSTIRGYTHSWSYNVQNVLPGPPLTFLRSGFLLLTTFPQSRSSRLSNEFYLFCALKEGKAVGQILGLQDYENERNIQKCIDSNCLLEFTLKKIDGKQFVLSWLFNGPDSEYTIVVKRATVVEGGKICQLDVSLKITQRNGFSLLDAPSCPLFP